MTPLPQQEILSTFAEMGIAIVGFAMVADVLRSRSATDVLRLYTLRDVAEIGLTCAVMSAFPLAIYELGLSAHSTWRISSCVVVVWAIAGITFSARRRGRGGVFPIVKRHWVGATIVFLLIAVSLALALANVLSPGPFSGARHVAWTLTALAQAGTMFIFAVFDLREDTPAA